MNYVFLFLLITAQFSNQSVIFSLFVRKYKFYCTYQGFLVIDMLCIELFAIHVSFKKKQKFSLIY